MSIQAIVFDFGNVIGQFDHLIAARALADRSPFQPDELIRRLFAANLIHDLETGRIAETEFLQAIRRLGELRGSDEELAHAFSDIFWPNAEVCELIARLAPRYRLVLGSNTNALHARRFQEQFRDTLGHFHARVLSHEVGARKPDAAFYRHCQERAGCPAPACLFIDDLAANVEAARASGLQAILYREYADLAARLSRLGIDAGTG